MNRILLTLVFASTLAFGQAPTKTKSAPPKAPAIKPTEADVPYGPHPKQKLDFYKAASDKPTALMFFIHGGGWVAGTKSQVTDLKKVLDAGVSVVSVEYRFIQEAIAENVKPPVSWPLQDAARALQFVRSKAGGWNIDKQRIGACGGSAGACSSLWLAFHDDMADPKSSDPIARESTHLWCAAVIGAQTSLDPKQLKEWTPNSRYGGHAFGFFPNPQDLKTRDTDFANFLAHRDEVLPWIKLYSPIELVSAGDSPVYLIYTDKPEMGAEKKDPTHTANYGVKLQEKCKSLGVPCEFRYPDAPDAPHASAADYLIDKLKASN